MSDAETEQEPTMEEILASIRRIISDDDQQDGEAEAAAPAEDDVAESAEADEEPVEEAAEEPVGDPVEEEPVDEPAAADEGDDTVLELTEVVNDDGSVSSLTDEDIDLVDDEPDLEADLDDDLDPDLDDDLDAELESDFAPEPEEQFEPAFEAEDNLDMGEVPAPAALQPDPLTLVSDPTAHEAASSFAQLTGTVSEAHGMPLGGANKTLEDVAKELLRPMLKEWLDANLPSLVERLVEKEIAKIADRGEKL